MSLVRALLGLALALGLTWALWQGYANYGRFANLPAWTGNDSLGWLRPWLTEFRMPLLCIAAFLGLTFVSWLWSKLKLGH